MKHKAHTAWYEYFAVVCILMVIGITGVMAQEETAEKKGVSGFMRVDTDALGTQIWFGATHPLGGLNIVSDIYVLGATGEFDTGLSFTIGENLILSPMGGIVFDFESTNVKTFVPQFYVFWTLGKLYLESWELTYIGLKDESPPNSFYNRTFLLYSLNDTISIGPQVELLSLNLEDTEDESDNLISLIVGGGIKLSYGDNNTLGLFLGYETKEETRGENDGIAGRFTFIREW
jgi:hypothetical protein